MESVHCCGRHDADVQEKLRTMPRIGRTGKVAAVAVAGVAVIGGLSAAGALPAVSELSGGHSAVETVPPEPASETGIERDQPAGARRMLWRFRRDVVIIKLLMSRLQVPRRWFGDRGGQRHERHGVHGDRDADHHRAGPGSGCCGLATSPVMVTRTSGPTCLRLRPIKHRTVCHTSRKRVGKLSGWSPA